MKKNLSAASNCFEFASPKVIQFVDTYAMKKSAPKPLICVTANAMESAEKRRPLHATGVRNVNSLLKMVDCVPVLLPPVGAAVDIDELVARMDGFVLPGGRANVEPHHYGGPEFPPNEPIDPGRDAIVLPLVRACIAARVPVFGICRGIQEINVALGGSLHYRVHEVPGKKDHRRPRHEDATQEEVFRLNHMVKLTAGGLFQKLTGYDEMMVNSLHGQGVGSVHGVAMRLRGLRKDMDDADFAGLYLGGAAVAKPLMVTVIHEFAHHIDYAANDDFIGGHNYGFWSLLRFFEVTMVAAGMITYDWRTNAKNFDATGYGGFDPFYQRDWHRIEVEVRAKGGTKEDLARKGGAVGADKGSYEKTVWDDVWADVSNTDRNADKIVMQRFKALLKGLSTA